jgi:hypothetical protein
VEQRHYSAPKEAKPKKEEEKYYGSACAVARGGRGIVDGAF